MTIWKVYKMRWLLFLSDGVCGVILPIMLLGVGFFVTIRLRGFPFLHPKRTLQCLKTSRENHSMHASLKAVCMALGGTLGVGNIAGVALALAYGGPGSLFWMWVSALLAMLLKYAEVLLATDSQKNADSPLSSRGSLAMDYLFWETGKRKRAKTLLFCLSCIGLSFVLGGMIQSAAIAEICEATLEISPNVIGVLLCIAVFGIIFGGAKRISGVIWRLIPLATLLYIILTVGVILTHLKALPRVLLLVFSSAFSGRSMVGGALGYSWILALRVGCSRGLLSNEAGCGTAPMAHATSNNTSPQAQGILGIFEVFVDTILLCSLTGLSILCANVSLTHAGGGMGIVGEALRTTWGKGAELWLCICVILFGLSTILCWSFYGNVAISRLSLHPMYIGLFRVAFCLSLFFGACFEVRMIWSLCDILLTILTMVNLSAILHHIPRIEKKTREFGLIQPKPPKK